MSRPFGDNATLGSAPHLSAGPDGPLEPTPISVGQPLAVFAPGVLVAGRYRLTQLIGQGGMAQVWKAAHEELRVDVAIKFLEPRLASNPNTAPAVLGRFRFEAQVSAQLAARTQHVVAVHDAGSDRGIPYLAMQLVTGRDLEREVLAEGPLSAPLMADVVDQIADALEAAHALGIVHRDLKPSNVLLVPAEEKGRKWIVKVADFGVAKAVDPTKPFDLPNETTQGLLVGSPSFMSPEQAACENNIDARSDIWSLGVLVYECLTGKSCFERKSLPDTLVAIALRQYLPLRQVTPELGSRIDAWMDRCLALEPARRFQSARAAAEAFREALATSKRPRRSVVAPLVALVFVPLALGVGLFVWRGSVGETSAAAPPSATSVSSSPSQEAAADSMPSVKPSVSGGSSAEALPSPGGTAVHSAVALSTPGPAAALSTPGPAAAARSTSASGAPPPASAPTSTETPATPPPATVATPAKWPQKKVDPSEVH